MPKPKTELFCIVILDAKTEERYLIIIAEKGEKLKVTAEVIKNG